MLIRSGCFGAGFYEGEPLVAEVGDDLQAAAESFDVGGQGAQFGGAWLGMFDGGHAALQTERGLAARWVLNQAAQSAKRSPEFAATCTRCHGPADREGH
jgi:cytochrome c553